MIGTAVVMVVRSPTLFVSRVVLELAFRALDDAATEIEAFEHDVDWYTASQKMMDRIEKSRAALKEILQ